MSDFLLKEANIAIIGLGLMGGSMALSLKERCHRLVGLDSDPDTVALAIRQGIVHAADRHPEKILQETDMVILACPVPAIVDWIQHLPEYIQHPCIVLDIGSSKRTIVSALETLPPHFDPIGGHPICGREQLSLANAERFLYRHAPFVLTPISRTSQRARSAALQILAAIGSEPVWLEANDHDRILAYTSHLPYLLSAALSLAAPGEVVPLVGPGFQSVLRLAGTPSSMMLGVLLSNVDHVLASIERFRQSLDMLEFSLKTGDGTAIKSSLDESRRRYSALLSDPGNI